MFKDGDLTAQVQAFQKRVEQAAIFMLKYLGEELAKYAKDMHNYTDRTGNLTNSIGYAIAKGADLVSWGGPDSGGDGADAALKTALKMIGTLPHQYTLVIVAGMEYAAYVEAKGYNVILPAELKAQTDFPIEMRKLMTKANAKAQQLFGTTI